MPGAPYPVAAFSQDGTYLAVSDGELIDVLDLKTGKLIAEALADGDDYIISLLFSPDDHVLLALDFTGEIRWWDWQRGKVLGSILIQGIDSLASIEEFRCAGASYIVVWNYSGVAVYDINRLKLLWSKPWHCTGCSSQPGRSLLAVTISKDGMVYNRIAFIDSRTGELRRPKD
jgi:WD40 repeat protein